MRGILNFLKNWVLIIALLVGCLAHNVLIEYADKTMYLIFGMLFFTFCRIDPSQLRLRRVHWVFLSVQILGAALSYYILRLCGAEVVAESVMMCILTPTAAASAVVTMKLGGDMASSTTYVLLSSVAVALVVPLWFPLINPAMEHLSFWTACWGILKRVMPLLLGPFLLAMLLKGLLPKVHDKVASWHEVSFYLWALCLVFSAAQLVDAVDRSDAGRGVSVLLVVCAVVICLGQFALGKRWGGHYGDRVSGGQSLGQKNIVLGIWISYMFLSRAAGETPLVVVALGAYIITQNIVNSWQLYRMRMQTEAHEATEMVP